MSIQIIRANQRRKYDTSTPLEEQVENADEVVIDYKPKDSDIEKFLEEMERLCKSGVTCDVSVELVHNNYLRGAKAKKQLERLQKDMKLNEAIKLLVSMYASYDKTLVELSDFCLKAR